MFLNRKTRKKLQEFLSEMPEESLSTLVSGIEKARIAGSDDPLANMILLTARQNAIANNAKMPRMPGPLRLFSVPFENFLVDCTIGTKQPGRIDRSSVVKIWQWLARDLMPAELARLSNQAKSAILANDQERARVATEGLRAAAVKSIHALAKDFKKFPKEQARIAGQLGGNQVLGDAVDVADILAAEEDLRVLRGRIASRIVELGEADISWCLTQLEGFRKYHSEMLPHGLVLIMRQLEKPAEIVRLAKKFLGTDDAIKIEAHPYGATVEIVLYDVLCLVKQICDALDQDADIDSLKKMILNYHNLMHSLQIELVIPASSKWFGMINQLRSKLSDRLAAKLEEAPRLIKTALKADSDGMNEPALADVAAAENALQLMEICRSSSDELALNELLSRVRREIELFMNAMGDAAVESLRSSTSAQRVAAKARADVAVYLTRMVFGNEIADLLRKAANIAINAADDRPDFKLADSA